MRRRATLGLRWPSAPAVVSFLVVVGVVAFVMWQLHPSLVFRNDTVAGGDTGSQVGLPYYFEHGILPHFRLTGWSPWWYDGYPQYTFYFPLPAIFVAILNVFMPYNVAFKLITVAGSLLLPVAAWGFGRLSGMRRPGPELLAVFTLPFLFDTSYQIYGGNLASTLAGEYSYSLSLAFGLLFLGVLARGLDTGRRRGLAAVLLAITALCHVVPAIFFGIVAVIVTLARLDRHRLWWSITAGVTGVAIIGFWAIPFVAGLPYTSTLGFQKLTTYGASMFPGELIWAVVLGGIGAVASLVRKRRVGIVVLLMAAVAAILLVFDPLHSLYNARFLPLWILCVYLLAGVGLAELATLVAEGWAWWRTRRGTAGDLGRSVLAALAAVEAEVQARSGELAPPRAPPDAADLHAALARDRADLAEDPTEWGAELRERARVALALDPELALAYEVKEAFVAATALALDMPALAMAAMDLWAALAEGSGLTPFVKLGWRLSAARPELEAYLVDGRHRGWAKDRLSRRRASGVLAPPRVDPRTFTGARPVMVLVAPIASWILVAGIVVVPLGLSWMPINVTQSYLPSWIHWNYSGYQGKSTYPEFKAINTTMARVGATYGCGRAMWEYGPELNDLGTPEALMLLPYFTHGCIDSMEGLLFESSATTPYHFLNQAELSKVPSEPVAGLPYGSLDVAVGTKHLQLLGVRYYMAFTPAAEAQANADPALRLLTTTGPWPTVVKGQTINRTWDIYLVSGSSTVTPLDTQPVVLTGVNKRSSQSWLNASLIWYDDPSRWSVMEAESGPASWARVPAANPTLPATPVTPTTVSHIANTNTTISFDVSRLGSPVLVKTSYFPNWKPTGAKGPYRVAPNLMVVVPTAHHVSLTYGRTAVEWGGTAVTIAGLAGAAWMAWRPPVPMRPPVEPLTPAAPAEPSEPELVGAHEAGVGTEAE
ncbi:MAG: transposase [Acidimicrobiales bacterium]